MRLFGHGHRLGLGGPIGTERRYGRAETGRGRRVTSGRARGATTEPSGAVLGVFAHRLVLLDLAEAGPEGGFVVVGRGEWPRPPAVVAHAASLRRGARATCRMRSTVMAL